MCAEYRGFQLITVEFSGLFRQHPHIRLPREEASNLLQGKGDDTISWLSVFLELSEEWMQEALLFGM